MALDTMFEQIVHHDTINVDRIQPNSLYCITTFNFNKLEFLPSRKLDININALWCSDWGYLEETDASGTPTKIEPFVVGNLYVAYYLPEYNSIICPDFPHNKNYVNYQPVINWLRKNIFTKIYKKTTKSSKVEVTVGCDPEFELLSITGDVIEASKIVGSICKSELRDVYKNKYGLDGACSQVELRPSHSKNEDDVINSIKETLDEYQSFDLTTKGDNYPLGAHIHIGAGNEGTKLKALFNDSLINAYDTFFGNLFYKLNGRKRSDYSQLGQAREQPHGFEYRSLPSAVFENPEIARIVLKGFKNIAEKVYNKGLEYTVPLSKEDYVNCCNFTEKEYETLMNFPNTYKGVGIVDNWISRKVKVPIKINNTIGKNRYVDKLIKLLKNIKLPEEYTVHIIAKPNNVGVGYPKPVTFNDPELFVIALGNDFIKYGIGFSNILMSLVWSIYAMHKKDGKVNCKSYQSVCIANGVRLEIKELTTDDLNLIMEGIICAY